MLEESCLKLIESIINTQKDLVVVFKNEVPIMTNRAFNSFLGVKSFDEYISDAVVFVEHFAMHPSYFNKDKIDPQDSWFDSILKLEPKDRIVSMINTKYEPRAFMLNINSIDEFQIVSFEDITKDLIKRIMIENSANIDKKSGAYAKDYFLQIKENFEDAASFNEKIIALSSITISSNDDLNNETLKSFVTNFKSIIRQDDMLVKWKKDQFIFIYLVDNETNANRVISKLNNMLEIKLSNPLGYEHRHIVQKNNEKISKLLESIIS